jgi:alanine dehydrogenase
MLLKKQGGIMKFGIVKEIKVGEARVAMTPENVKILTNAGHEVYVQTDAGIGAGFTNDSYVSANAILCDQEQVWDVDVVVKVKEPLACEYKYFKQDLIVWGFLHLAASKECVLAMKESGTTAIAGETINLNGQLELLKPMSAIAGRRAIFMGAYYLEKQHGGEGILLSGIEGVQSGTVVILGGGNAAVNACDIACSIGCHVTILELSQTRINYLKELYKEKSVTIIESTTSNLESEIKKADIFVSTILIPGTIPPKIVKEYMIKSMKPGSVVIDISIDQGGTIETIDKYTTHDDPIFIKHGVIHYAVPNMPGAVPRTATIALAQGNINYLLSIGNIGLENTVALMSELASGINIYKNNVTHAGLASTLEIEYKDIMELI